MKNSLFLGSALGVLLLAGTASAAKVKYVATLSGDQQVPAVTTTATGTAEFEFDDETKVLTGTITYEGVTATAAHIHEEACGKNGAPVVDFGEPAEIASPITIPDDTTLDDTEAAALAAGKWYINIHSAENGDGEIRGQLLKEGETCQSGGGGDTDAGTTGGTDGGSSGTTAPGKDGGSSGSSGSATPASTSSSCSTSGTGSAPASGLAVALGLGLAVAAVSRSRRKR